MHMYVCMYACMYVCTDVHVHVHVYVQVTGIEPGPSSGVDCIDVRVMYMNARTRSAR